MEMSDTAEMFDTTGFVEDCNTCSALSLLLIAEFVTSPTPIILPAANTIAVFVVAADEAAVMFTQAEGFPTIYNEVQWFGADTTSHRQRLVDNAPEQAAHLRVPSPLPAQSDNVKFKEFESPPPGVGFLTSTGTSELA